MPQFFFNFRHENGLDPDREGLVLPNLDAAYMEAFEAAKEMWIRGRSPRSPRLALGRASFFSACRFAFDWFGGAVYDDQCARGAKR